MISKFKKLKKKRNNRFIVKFPTNTNLFSNFLEIDRGTLEVEIVYLPMFRVCVCKKKKENIRFQSP